MKCSNKLCKYNDDYYRDNCRNTIHAELAIQCMKNGFNHYEPADLPEADAYSLLADVLLEIEKLEDWKDVKDLKFMADKIRQEHFS